MKKLSGQLSPFRKFFLFFLLIFVASAVGCNSGNDDPGYEPPDSIAELGKADVWLTTGDQVMLLSKQDALPVTRSKESNLPVITIDSTQMMQEIEGFGAALTGSSAYLINKKMNVTQRNALLKDLFNPESGIGISYLRMTIGASDFSLSDYTYDDMPSGETDFDLKNFSIAKDKEDVVPVFGSILQVAPDLKIMASPWSPPAWMKTNGSLKGGKLKTDAYEVYARYFVKFIEAYESEGIAIDAITVQNEPLHHTANYPCMEMTAEEQKAFVRDHLGPEFENSGINTKIIVYDHNWDNTEYAISILNDADARKYITGSAFHAYAGNVSAMNVVHNAHSDKGLYFTEISGGEWATNFKDNLQWNMSNIFIGTTKNWSKAALLWNLALDQNHGPQNNGCSNCRGVVTIDSGTGSVVKNVEYFALGHFSKFVRPGARRIEATSSEPLNGLDYVAFMNTNGSKILIVANQDTEVRSITVKQGGREFSYGISAESVATIVW